MENREKDKVGGSAINISGGQQGVVGHNASVGSITQVSQAPVDIKELTDSIVRLREAMAAEAADSEQYIALGSVASAEKEAKAGNQSKAIEYLKSAGQWAADMAQKIGVNVITKAIQGQIGM